MSLSSTEREVLASLRRSQSTKSCSSYAKCFSVTLFPVKERNQVTNNCDERRCTQGGVPTGRRRRCVPRERSRWRTPHVPPPLGVIPHNLCSLAACLASLGARLLPFLRHLASGQVEAAAAAVDSPASTTSASYLVLFPAVGAEERTGSRTAIITSATWSVTWYLFNDLTTCKCCIPVHGAEMFTPYRL